MTKAAEMIGVRTGEKIEFNPQVDLLGKIVRHPGMPPRYLHGAHLKGTFAGTI